MTVRAFRAALSGASLFLAACAADGPPERAPVVIGPRAAGLAALDALAPAFGGAARLDEAECGRRYAAEALSGRCLALGGDPAALGPDITRLRALAAAMAASGADAEEARFLAAMDALFDPLAGRAAPSGGAAARDFAAAERRLATLLTGEGPGWGARSLASAMKPGGAPLSAPEAAALARRLEAAEAALSGWRAAKAAARAPEAALAAYAEALAAGEAK